MSGNFVITLLEYLNTLSAERRGGNMLNIGFLVFSEQLQVALLLYCSSTLEESL